MSSIEDYFLIGDFHSAALVSTGGSVDWLCWPEFDSPSIFASLLDENAGLFSVEAHGYRTECTYVENTAVVEHVFHTESQSASTAAFVFRYYMVPVEEEVCRHHFLMRKFLAISGESPVITLHFNPRPHYGTIVPALRTTVDETSGKALFFNLGDDTVYLHVPEGVEISANGRTLNFRLEPGQSMTFALEYCKGRGDSAFAGEDQEEFTTDFWRRWVGRGHYFDFCRSQLVRSAITLKLMQYYPTGGLIAAPTTSLPVEFGGTRNWDYRYVWIRDATFTLYAFYVLDYQEEMDRFFGFLKSATGDNDEIRTLYTIRGDAAPEERFLEHMDGFRDSRPVRVGNNASTQLQLDVYGNMIDAYYFMSQKRKRNCEVDRDDLLGIFRRLKSLWCEKDGGIWEARDELYHYSYSKVMAWVGFDRLIKLQDQVCLPEEELAECRKLRDEAMRWIWEHCWDLDQQNLVQFPETKEVDSANLFFVILKFLDKSDERTRTIIRNTCEKLCSDDVLVYRYLRDDGLEGTDQGFLLCSFWLVSVWAILEDVDRAQKLFHDLEGYLNDNHLMPEQLHMETKQYLGNYPQAFSHMGYIMTARYLDKYRRRKRAAEFGRHNRRD